MVENIELLPFNPLVEASGAPVPPAPTVTV
jgi:hypothetical protein